MAFCVHWPKPQDDQVVTWALFLGCSGTVLLEALCVPAGKLSEALTPPPNWGVQSAAGICTTSLPWPPDLQKADVEALSLQNHVLIEIRVCVHVYLCTSMHTCVFLCEYMWCVFLCEYMCDSFCLSTEPWIIHAEARHALTKRLRQVIEQKCRLKILPSFALKYLRSIVLGFCL